MLLRKDALTGLLFIAIAIFGLWISHDYPIGTTLRMGTGYVPRMLCWLLLGLGGLILVQALRATSPRAEGASARLAGGGRSFS